MNSGDLPLLQGLLNLFIEQALMLQTKELPEHNLALKFQVAFMLDEVAISRPRVVSRSSRKGLRTCPATTCGSSS